MNLIDKSGKKFGRLTVINRASNKGKSPRWNCICECGKHTVTHSSLLREGSQISCGCLRVEVSSQLMTRMNLKHGESRTRLNAIWREMRYRCNTPTADAYPDYGGRGVSVCTEWNNSFEVFREWALANGYQDHLTIDRENNNGNYEPGNCRWVDMKVQSNNKRTNINLTYKGETLTATQWAEKLGLKKPTVFSRIRQGLSVDEILNPLVSPINKAQYHATPNTQEKMPHEKHSVL